MADENNHEKSADDSHKKPHEHHSDDADTSKNTDTPEQTNDTDAKSNQDDHASKDSGKSEAIEDTDEGPFGKVVVSPDKRNIFVKAWGWMGRHKRISIPLFIVIVLAVAAAIPVTRYALAGTLLKQRFSVQIIDSTTHKPVSSALITIANKQVTTDSAGKATLDVPVGQKTMVVSKKYYKNASVNVLVPILKQKSTFTLSFVATGRQVPIVIINKVNKQPVANATIAASDTKATTDARGKAVLVLPADKQSVSATITASGYNTNTVQVSVTTKEDANTIAVTPAGKVYFLSNASGTIDIVKANLDGSARQIVLAGTGKEDRQNTVLLSSRDWHYAALLSKRDGGDNAKLFLLDTTSDKLTTMDEGQADFSVVGWNNHAFIYTVTRSAVSAWQPNRQALKSYDADSGKIVTLDQTTAQGDQNTYVDTYFGGQYILKDEIVYVKNWQSSYSYAAWQMLNNKAAEVHSVHADGTNNHVVKSYSLPSAGPVSGSISVNARLYEPQGIYLQFAEGPNPTNIDQYEDGAIKAVTNMTTDEFYQTPYPTYLISPNGNSTFWAEQRDGKNTLFVGDTDGKNGKQVAFASDYTVYGWYTDQYLLVSKSSSELDIMPVGGGDMIKLTDYYKPAINLSGYGYGYGGL